MNENPLRIGITCYPSVGGSGILATALGEELARRGHHVHFISYERPFRLPVDVERLHFHPVNVNDYGLFKYPDYTLPLSVKMAEVSRDFGLDVLHVHYAVPHATAALLACSMLPPELRPRLVTTLHGTDTTLLGRDADYGPAIQHALEQSDAVTTVSAYLKEETLQLFKITRPIEVIHNFFEPRPPKRSVDEVKREIGLTNETVLFHASNLRTPKRIDLLLETVARIRSHQPFKLVVLAGDSFTPFAADLRALGIEDRLLVLERVRDVEDYLQIADIGLFTSESESFCLSILEGMCFAFPSVARRVGGIPEVVEDGISGMLVPSDDPEVLAGAVKSLLEDPARRVAMGKAAQVRAQREFSAEAIVPRYETLYRGVCEAKR
jgi:N-acetyl-alpha-D-glucosaminyl L-malate synthase BshA